VNIKTEELTGAALDWAVAKCEGTTDFRFDTVATYWVTLDGKDRALSKGWAQSFNPSTDWSQGGPIIEREKIDLIACDADWEAQQNASLPMTAVEGATPLIAAMRCFVTSKLGDLVEVPDELCGSYPVSSLCQARQGS